MIGYDQSLTYKALNLDSLGLGAILVEIERMRMTMRRREKN